MNYFFVNFFFPIDNGPISEATLAECLPEFYINFTGTAAPYCNVHSPSSMVAPLNSVMAEFSINSSYRIAAFISQIGLESADLRCWEENPYWTGMCWNITDNCCYAGGCEYKGRGPIQLTNDFNYQVIFHSKKNSILSFVLMFYS